jgi:DNA-nicking Smr family endonuclease
MPGSKESKGTDPSGDKALDSEIWERYTRSIAPVSKSGARVIQAADPQLQPPSKTESHAKSRNKTHAKVLPTRAEFGALLDGKVKARPVSGQSSTLASTLASTSPSAPTVPQQPAQIGPTKTGPTKTGLAKSGSAKPRFTKQGSMAEASKRKPPPKPISSTPAIDSHLLRRTKRGSGVDARIDLHGMRRDEAYHALLGFLGDCHHRQLKLVLVITGKGTNSRQAEDWWDMPERGVLKRMVPQWLSQPSFSRLVAGHSEAGRADGGSGALYVQIRSPRWTPHASAEPESRT